MIYTLGKTIGYDRALAEAAPDDPVNKIGRRKANAHDVGARNGAYPGGSVWRTAADAQAYIDMLPDTENPTWDAADFSVYAVAADWETGTYQHDGPWRSLLHDAPIVRKVPR